MPNRLPPARLALLLVACTPSPTPSPAPATDPKPPVADAIPSTDTKPSGDVLPTDTKPPESDASPPATATTLPSAPPDAAFQLAAYRDGDLSLHVLGDIPFVLGAVDIARLDPDGTRLIRDDDALAGMPEPNQALGDWETLAFGGTWPSDAWLVTQHRFQRLDSHALVQHREGGRWTQIDNEQGDLYWHYAAVLARPDGRLLGLRVYTLDPDVEELTWRKSTYAGARAGLRQLAAARPRFDLLGPLPTPAPPTIARDLAPITAAIAPTGELFLLGKRGGNESEEDYHPGFPVLQRWTPDGPPAGVESKLPIVATCDRLAVRSATEVHVACDGELLRFDGSAWSKAPVPKNDSLRGLSVARDGTLWIVVDPSLHDTDRNNELWRRPPGGAWEKIELPELRFPDRAHAEWTWDDDRSQYRLSPPAPDDAARTWPVSPVRVHARAGGDVWVAGYVGMLREGLSSYPVLRDVVLRNGPIGAPLRLLPDSDLRLELLDARPAKPWTAAEGCPQGQPAFVTVRTQPRDALPAGSDPAVDALIRDPAALAGVTGIFEVFRGGRPTIGLFVAPADQPAADALLATLARMAPGEPHALECRQPRRRREFDRTTGRPLQSPVL